jgi:hypothetical protein
MTFPLVTKFAEDTKDEPLKKELLQLLQLGNAAAERIVKVLNEVFIKTATIINGSVSPEGATIESLLEDFVKAANERGITNIWTDGDITAWFPKATVSKTVAGPSRLLRFVNAITHADIIDNCKQLNAFQEFDLGDGIKRATALVAAGELDKKDNSGIIIYLTNRKDGTPCRLDVWRRDGGELVLDVYEVDLGDESDAGNGVLASNENLGE